jgi:hypothetical protein
MQGRPREAGGARHTASDEAIGHGLPDEVGAVLHGTDRARQCGAGNQPPEMARRPPDLVGSRTAMRAADQSRSSFPQWVAWISLVTAIVLFFGNTVPGVREREGLRHASADLRDLRARYDRALEFARPGTPGATGEREDLQTLLVAIDRLGWTPQELIAQFPAEQTPAGQTAAVPAESFPDEPIPAEPIRAEPNPAEPSPAPRGSPSRDTPTDTDRAVLTDRASGRPGNR